MIQLLDLQESLDCTVLPNSGFDRANNDLKFTDFYLLPTLDEKIKLGPIAIRKAHPLIPFKFGDIQPGGAAIFDSFLKACKTSETDKFPLTKESFTPVKWKSQNHSHMTLFYSELRR